MKYFGIDRVIEPVGTIPSTAWKIDNHKGLSPGEIRVSLDLVKIEDEGNISFVKLEEVKSLPAAKKEKNDRSN